MTWIAVVIVLSATSAFAQGPIWNDPATHLVWSAEDNGVGISGRQAERYCRESTLGGFHDWSLPSIDQLQALFGGAANESGRHVRGSLRVTGWEWSGTRGEYSGERWALDFGDGGRASVTTGDSGLNRALCVRMAASQSELKGDK